MWSASSFFRVQRYDSLACNRTCLVFFLVLSRSKVRRVSRDSSRAPSVAPRLCTRTSTCSSSTWRCQSWSFKARIRRTSIQVTQARVCHSPPIFCCDTGYGGSWSAYMIPCHVTFLCYVKFIVLFASPRKFLWSSAQDILNWQVKKTIRNLESQ